MKKMDLNDELSDMSSEKSKTLDQPAQVADTCSDHSYQPASVQNSFSLYCSDIVENQYSLWRLNNIFGKIVVWDNFSFVVVVQKKKKNMLIAFPSARLYRNDYYRNVLKHWDT